jgi:hypothetical protein
MKTKLNGVGILPLVCVLFTALALVWVSCTGPYTNPDVGGGSSSGTGGSVSSKPAYLSSGATLTEALAKLDEIIAYPETPNSTLALAESMKATLSNPYYYSAWPSAGLTMIPQINSMIDMIP